MNSVGHLFSEVSNSRHPHACIIYDDFSSYRRIALGYILEGLDRNEKCIMAVDSYLEHMIVEDFAEARYDLKHVLETGQLTIVDVKASYSGNGGFDPDHTVKLWQDASMKAVDEGYDALRVVGEATFSIGRPGLADKLIYYEHIINQVLFPHYPFKSLCVYDKNLYPHEVIKQAVSAHPILFHNADLFLENIHYVPPEIYFKDNRTRDEVDIWLENIRRNNQNIRSLRESEQKFRSIFRNAPMSYQSLDENGNFIEVNDTWLKVLGYERHEVIGKNFSDFLHPDWKVHFRENFPRFKAVGEVLGVEFEMVKKDGTRILVSFHGKIGKDEGDSFKQTHCVFQDITDRHKIEASLRRSNYNLKLAQEIAGIGNWTLDPQTGKAVWSDTLYQIYERKPEKGPLPLSEYPTIYRGEWWARFDAVVNDAICNGTPYDVELMVELPFGKKKWVHSICEPEKKPGPKGHILHGTIQDITDRKRLEEKQKRYTANLETIFNSAPNMLMLADENGRVENINDKGAQFTSRAKEELCGLLCGVVFKCVNAQDGRLCGRNPECRSCPVRSRIISTFETGKQHYEEEGQMTFVSDGKKVERFFLISTNLIDFDSDKKVLLSMTDITESKMLERRLLQAQKMESIGNLAGGIAHDFNNLLFPIVGMAELLLDDLPDGSPEWQNVREILKAGQRGSDLVKQILSFSRQEAHKKIPVRIQRVMKEVVTLVRSMIPKDIEINHRFKPDCGLVMADPTQLHQVAMNLITNAFHAMESTGGHIDITVEEVDLESDAMVYEHLEPGRYVRLAVSDNGSGIAPADLDKIFDPYFTTKVKGKGTGLGLSVVYGIVKDHDGGIQVSSEVGIGTTFNVFLPLMHQGADDEAGVQKEPIQTGKETILLVDDEESIVRLEKQMLERMGYTVVARTSSVEALEAFKSNPEAFDLIISDMTMPNLTGDRFAQQVKKIKPGIPVIICTGFSEKISEKIAKDLGIKGFLMKPMVRSEMASLVRKVLDEKQSNLLHC